MNEITISDDKSLIDKSKVVKMLNSSYWAEKRTKEKIFKSIENSICYGAYIGNIMVGFLRIVTDYSTMYWICDVVVDEDYRRKEIGKKLMEVCLEDERLNGCFGILATKDAHGFYERYGFRIINDKFMRKDAK